MINEKKLNRGDLCDICRSVDCANCFDANCFDEEDFKKWIDRQPKVGEWIPVSERLPKEAESVILTAKDDSADSPIYYTSVGWYYNGIWIVENTVCYQVTAWMPLPKPYKEGEQE